MMAARFEDAARTLLSRLNMRPGTVNVHQSRRADGQRVIMVDVEPGQQPHEAPKHIDGFEVQYRRRKVRRVHA